MNKKGHMLVTLRQLEDEPLPYPLPSTPLTWHAKIKLLDCENAGKKFKNVLRAGIYLTVWSEPCKL